MRTSGVVLSGVGRAVVERTYYAGEKTGIPIVSQTRSRPRRGQFTVRETVAVWASDPAVPVTVTL
jgi:hypothetical protein